MTRSNSTAAHNPARHAAYLALGSLAGRILGLLREVTITRLFGQTGWVSAFTVASQIPVMLHDLIVGGYVSSAFIPVLAARYERAKPEDFGRLVGAMLLFFGALLLTAATGMTLLADPLARWMAGGFRETNPELVALTSQMVRMMSPVLWLTGMVGVLNAVLYAARRFAWPAVANAIFNLGIVILGPLLADRFGVWALVLGLWAGVLCQSIVLATDLRRATLRLRAALWHPGLREILLRYLPIVVGLIVAQIQIFLDRRWASGTGVSSIAWMRTATTLQQLPLGLISVSTGLATLPMLSQAYAQGHEELYRTRLVQGLRYVALLIVPVLAFVAVMGEPIIRVLFLRGAFTDADVAPVLAATRVYLLGAGFAALDLLLNNALYARGDTVRPTAVGVASTCLYLGTALTLLSPFGYMGLVWADTVKHAGHMLIMLVLVGRAGFGRGTGLIRILTPFLTRAGMAVAVSAGTVWGCFMLLERWWQLSFWHDASGLALCGLAGAVMYAAALYFMGIPELGQALGFLRERWRNRGGSGDLDSDPPLPDGNGGS